MEKWEFRERESFSVERDDRSVYLFSREREKRFDFLCHPVALPSLLHRFQILRSMDVDVKKKKFRSTFSLSLSSDNSLPPRNIWMTGQRQRSTTVRADFTRRHDDGFHDGDITRPVGHSGCSLLARTPFPYNAAPFPYAPRRAPGFHTRCLFFATPSPRVAALSRRLRSGSDTTPPKLFRLPSNLEMENRTGIWSSIKSIDFWIDIERFDDANKRRCNASISNSIWIEFAQQD